MLVLCKLLPLLDAASPTLDQFHPITLVRGATNHLNAAGKFDPWPAQAWVECEGIVLSAATNKSAFIADVSSNAPSGPHWVRIYNAEGASEPRLLILDDIAPVFEKEPNDSARAPQVLDPAVTIVSGRLDKGGDVDSFAIDLEPEQILDARLEAYVLGSKIDALLRLVDRNGRQLAWNHDGTTLDPQLRWHCAAATNVVIQVMGFVYPANADARLTGGDACVYRLHLGRQTEPNSSNPLGVQPESVSSTSAPSHADPRTSAAAPTANLPLELEAGTGIDGVIGTPGHIERHALRAAQAETLAIRVTAASMGSPLDAWLAIEDSTGKELARSDDADGSPDPRLEWTAPSNGVYRIAVGNVLAAGSHEHGYRLQVESLRPEFRATMSSSSAQLKLGTTNEIKLTVTRLRGFDAPLGVRLAYLPDGVEADPVTVPAKGGEVAIRLMARPDAKPGHARVQILVVDMRSTVEHLVPFQLSSSTTDNGVPGGFTKLLRETIDHVWLTVTGP